MFFFFGKQLLQVGMNHIKNLEMYSHLLSWEYCYLLVSLLLDTAEGNLSYLSLEVNVFTKQSTGDFVAEGTKSKKIHL